MQHPISPSQKQSAKPWRLAGCLLLSLSLPCIAQADWPVAIVDSTNATTSQSIAIKVLENDIGEGLELTAVNATTKKWGSASINADKQSVTYQSRADFVGTDTFWYAFKDSEGRTNSAKVTVTVSEAVRPSAWPSTTNDTIETVANKSIKIPVLDNDNGVGLKITSVNASTVGWGKAEIVDDGQSILYTPAHDYTGTDEFWYVFTDNWGRTNAGKVTPVVTPNYSGWPTAESDHTSVTSTATVTIPVLDNDFGKDLKIFKVNETTVGLGSAKIEENYIRYTPADGFTGQDSFWYAFEDAEGRKNSTQVFVDVSQNTELSSIEFCGATYVTDGTAENTTTSSQEADANATEFDLMVRVQPSTYEDDFINIGEHRYFYESGHPNNKLWMADRDTGDNAQEIAAEDDLYIIGSRNGVLYYAYNTREYAEQYVYTWVVAAYDGSEHKTIGEMDVYVVAQRIYLLDNTTELYLKNADFGNTGSRVYYHKFNELTGSLVRSAYELRPPFPEVEGRIVESIFSYNGFSYPGYFAANQEEGTSYYFMGQAYSDPQILGRRDRAIISNDRLLMTTQASENITSEGTTTLPATLYTATKDNEFIKLAECNE